ncbi:phosphoinositide phospholipase C 2-like [Cynara cardunculus var. scolymus]|uniref:phosphoinositide phospholipase C 2-like n=1 Tax=Cynara cardunculus var. scolymus TaxID=59895 RepID=UPI000D626712|nr:phosphoinositide phospholipase C 2-like [Cynara cardunculus var. scolymus]
MSKQSYKFCCCFRRRFKLGEVEPPADIKELFSRYSENGIMTAEHLQRFMAEVQGDDEVTTEEAQAAVDSTIKELKHLPIFHRRVLNLDAFFRYLFGDCNPPLPFPSKVMHDMEAPLAHYYIYTGHNSYLTGNQISSDCSDVPIIESLKRGVRVIELDMWPNSTKDDIDIVHGGTLTAPVKLDKCLEAIRTYAFVASEYPVIITLEDHLTPALQAKVAKMVMETYGDVLYCSESDSLTEFPSPELLKKRIVVSTKPPKEFLDTTKSMKESDVKTKTSGEDAWGAEISTHFKKQKSVDEVGKNINWFGKHDVYAQDDQDFQYEEETVKHNVEPEYKQLIAIHAKKLKGGVKDWLHDDPTAAKRISLRETRLEKAIENHATDVIRFTQRNLLRVFPKGSRVDSSNYNPLIGWTHGAQMVAFNMQGHGRSLWLMQGMFRANGGCGYVKKPDFLLKNGPDGKLFDPKSTLPVKRTLKVKLYMGDGWHLDFKTTHFDIYSPPDFYVKIGIAGVEADSVMKKTKIIQDAWAPKWEEEFEFPLTVPELALLRLEVHEYDMTEKDDFGGQTCLPVSELRTGIRCVRLHDQVGNIYNSVKLLLRFEFV